MAMRHNGFVAFILTHGRPDRVLTYEKLRKHGYTGKIYICLLYTSPSPRDRG